MGQQSKDMNMLIVQFKHTFRERFPEWVTSGMLVLWGISLLGGTEGLQRPYFIFLATLGSATFWGVLALLMGGIRLVSLYINGRRAQTPIMRMVGAAMGIMIWFGVFIGGMIHSSFVPSVALYLGLTVLDTAALYFSTIDARQVANNRGTEG